MDAIFSEADSWWWWLWVLYFAVAAGLILLTILWERASRKKKKQAKRQPTGDPLPQQLEAWLDRALAEVPGYEERACLKKELTAHLQETMEQFLAQGLDEETAAARTLENVGSADAFIESWHRENDKPLPWRLFLGIGGGAFLIGAGLMASFVLKMMELVASPATIEISGSLGERLTGYMVLGWMNTDLGRVGLGGGLWMAVGLVFLLQGLLGWRREQKKKRMEAHV